MSKRSRADQSKMAELVEDQWSVNKYWEETGRNTLTCGNRGPVTGRQRQKANLAKEDVVAQVCADQAPKASRSLLFLVTEGPFSSHGSTGMWSPVRRRAGKGNHKKPSCPITSDNEGR